MAVEHLLDQFYSLSGKTVAEKLKYLNHLINEVKTECLPDEIDQFIAQINPKNAFEKLLKGRLIDSFKKSQDLVDVLKCDDRLFIKQVLSCDWFFEGSSTDFPSCEVFMTDIFPNTSFATRHDIIHMMSLHMKERCQAEKLFEAIKRQYGTQQATPLLCKCSPKFIQSVVDTDGDQVCFTHMEVSKLCKLYPQMVKCNIKKKCFSAHISKILQVFISVDVKLFTELFVSVDCDVYDVKLKIGRRLSKKIIDTNPAAIINSAGKYRNILDLRYLYKYLTQEEFTSFYIALFPDSCNDCYFFQDNGDFYTLGNMFPPKECLEMLLGCYEKVYGKSLLGQTDLVQDKLLQMLPPDERERCAQQKINKCLEENEETHWLCYLKTEKSLPLLQKRLIEASDSDERSRLLSCLVRTCHVNKDLESLDSICKHFVLRYRNDNFWLRSNFLNSLDQTFDLLKVGDRLWSYVLEVIKIFFLNDEYQKNIRLICDVLVKSIHYKLKRNCDISAEIDQLIIVKSFLCSVVNNWLVLEKEPKYQEIMFEAFSERIPEVKKVKEPLSEMAFSLLKSAATWNKKNKLFHFSLSKFPWAVESLKKYETELDKMKKKSFLGILNYDLETKHLLFPDKFEKKIVKDSLYYLRMDTEQLIQNAEKEVTFLLSDRTEMYKQVFRTWNLLSFTKVKETVVQVCTRLVESDTDTHIRANAIFVLSLLMEADKFSSVVAPFCPKSGKIAVDNDETEKILPLSKTSAMCLHNVNPWHNFNSITDFCKGDYVQFVLGSLMSVCYNTSEKKVVPYLERLTNSPVSVKKHAVRLTLSIVCKPQVLPLLKKLWSADRNPAVREVLLGLVFHAFQMQPSPDMFTFIKYCISSLTVEDKNTFYNLTKARAIPDNYKGEYVELCWYKLHELLEKGAKMKPVISVLAFELSYIIDLLASDFCDCVLKQYFIKDSPLWNESVELASSYLLHSQNQEVLNMRFDQILNSLKDLVQHGTLVWRDVTHFFNQLCIRAVNQDRDKYNADLVLQLLQKFVAVWASLLSCAHSFEAFVFLQFTNVYYSCAPDFDLQIFGKNSSDLVATLIEEYGWGIITIVSETFVHFVRIIEFFRDYPKWKEIPVQVVTGLLMEPTSKVAFIMAAHLIPEDFAYLEEQKERYSDLIATVLRIKDATVSLIISSLDVFKNNSALHDCQS